MLLSGGTLTEHGGEGYHQSHIQAGRREGFCLTLESGAKDPVRPTKTDEGNYCHDEAERLLTGGNECPKSHGNPG